MRVAATFDGRVNTQHVVSLIFRSLFSAGFVSIRALGFCEMCALFVSNVVLFRMHTHNNLVD